VGAELHPPGQERARRGQALRLIPMRLDLRYHSPDGFEWGYGGSGPARFVFAILADAIGDREAQRLYQDFK